MDRRARHNQFVGTVHGAGEGRHRHGYGDEQRAVEQVCVRDGDSYCADTNANSNAQPILERVVQRLELPGVPGRSKAVARRLWVDAVGW